MIKKIAVIYGGKSPEHEVSCDSATSIINELRSAGHDVIPVYIARTGRWLVQEPDQAPAEKGTELFPSFAEECFLTSGGDKIKPDVLFPIIHGTTGEDGILQGVLEMTGLPYAGSGVAASAAGMNKVVSKQLARSAGINVLPHVILTVSDENYSEKISEAEKMGFPLFVKPVSQGSSVGITKVKRPEDIEQALKNAFRFDRTVMIEKGVDSAREMVCGVLGGTYDCMASMVGEVCVQGGHEFYDYEAKYLDDNGMKLVIPASIDKEHENYIKNAAVKIFRALGCNGFSRVDFFVDRKSGEIWFGEINTAPGFTSHSLYPSLWKKNGMPVKDVLEKLIEIAVDEKKAGKKLEIRR